MIYNSPVYLDGYWAIRRKVVLATNAMLTYIDYNKSNYCKQLLAKGNMGSSIRPIIFFIF
jgi:hypothetical protein